MIFRSRSWAPAVSATVARCVNTERCALTEAGPGAECSVPKGVRLLAYPDAAVVGLRSGNDGAMYAFVNDRERHDATVTALICTVCVDAIDLAGIPVVQEQRRTNIPFGTAVARDFLAEHHPVRARPSASIRGCWRRDHDLSDEQSGKDYSSHNCC